MQAVRKGRISSAWLKRHILEHGGVMNVSTRMVIAG